jgi:hypothetical protein
MWQPSRGMEDEEEPEEEEKEDADEVRRNRRRLFGSVLKTVCGFAAVCLRVSETNGARKNKLRVLTYVYRNGTVGKKERKKKNTREKDISTESTRS